MQLQEVMTALQSMGNESVKKMLLKHGAREPFFGVKVADLKKVLKQVKHDLPLALELYKTGNADAMYLAGLIANGAQMTKAQLQTWAEKAPWHMISENTVPWVASESPFGYELALEWIQSPKEMIAAAGWNTLSNIASMRPDEELDLATYKKLLLHVPENIHTTPNRVRYVMNSFVITVGCYIKSLTDTALKVAGETGTVMVDMGDTACKVPPAAAYIRKVQDRGSIGKKKKTVKC